MRDRRFHGKRAIVTGAASGIGRATARLLVDDGATVVGLDRDTAVGWKLCGEEERLAFRGIEQADVSDEGSVRTACERAVETLGGVDYLVNCAGIEGRLGDLLKLSAADWDRVFAVNARGTFLAIRALIKRISEDGGGAIVNLGSDAGLTGVAGFDAYAASKHAVVGLTRCLALSWGRRGVRVNVVCPGMTATPMAERIFGSSDEAETPEKTRSFIPQGRFGQPGEIASTIAFLLSDDAAYINGAAVSVDGGSTAGYYYDEERDI